MFRSLWVSIILMFSQLPVVGGEAKQSERAILLQDTFFSAPGLPQGSEMIRVRENTEVQVLERSKGHLIVEHFGAKARVSAEEVRVIPAARDAADLVDKEALFDEARQRKKEVEQEQMNLWGLEARTLNGEVLSVLEDGILLTLGNSEFRIVKVVTKKDVVDGDKFRAMAMPLANTFTYQAASGGAKTVRVWKDIEVP